MKILNIIVIGETTASVTRGLIDLKSYVCEDEQLSNEVVEEAEEYFTSLLQGLGVSEDDIDSYIEDGFYENASQSISMVWTYPENLQV